MIALIQAPTLLDQLLNKIDSTSDRVSYVWAYEGFYVREKRNFQLKMILKNACTPAKVFELLREIQLIEVDHRIMEHRNRFTGELHTTHMMYRAFNFANKPEGTFLHEITVDKMQQMVKKSDDWIVSFLFFF